MLCYLSGVQGMTHTVQLACHANGNYWISILDDYSPQVICPDIGPFTRDKIFHNLLLVGLDDAQAEFLTEMADLNHVAEIAGVAEKEYSDDV